MLISQNILKFVITYKNTTNYTNLQIAALQMKRLYIYNIGITLVLLLSAVLLFPFKAAAQDDLKFHTIVIDAGHGGKDPGAISRDKTVKEKDVNLYVAKKLGQLINENCPDVEVVYTRKTDVFVTLGERARIANSHKANLFLSIHVNAHDNSAANGFSCHILGQSSKKGNDTFAFNLDVSKRENSVILLEDDYTTKYQGFDPSDPESFIFFNLMQNAYYEQSLNFAAMVNEKMDKIGPIKANRGISQDPFFVLWKTTMPAMLFEMAFISNKTDVAVLKTDEGKDKIANALFEAFKQFKNDYNQSLNYNDSNSSATSSSNVSTEVKDNTKVEEKSSVKADNKAQTKEESEGKVDAGTKTEVDKVKTEVKDNGVSYGIQVSTVSRLIPTDDPFFRKNKVTVYQSGKVYRYVVGESSDKADVEKIREKVEKDFPGSFMVKIENGTLSRIK